MRAYSASSEEAVRTRDLLKDWHSEGLLTAEQYQRMEQETVCDLRRTNIFLRLVLFLFTLVIAGAAAGLFFTVFFPHTGQQTIGIFLLMFAVAYYAAAEFAVARMRLYRYGIEEALLTCAVVSLCLGLQLAFFGTVYSSAPPLGTGWEVPAAGVIASLWIWHRFGLPYAPVAAMLFVVELSSDWAASLTSRHLIIAALYSAGLVAVMSLRRRHRFTYLDREYSIGEALLWLGIYLAFNLQFSLTSVSWLGWGVSASTTQFPRPFYWTTWVLIWCLPPLVLARGLRGKDRFVIAAGAVMAALTLVTNKPYLGWPRQTWDPMLLGALLTVVAIWLAKGPGGIRRGFTARRLSAKDKHWINIGVSTIGFAAPDMVTPPHRQTDSADFHFGGGDSGGGGASSDF